jgi:hypothetical protein
MRSRFPWKLGSGAGWVAAAVSKDGSAFIFTVKHLLHAGNYSLKDVKLHPRRLDTWDTLISQYNNLTTTTPFPVPLHQATAQELCMFR